MKIVTINIPNQYLDCLESLVNLGYFPSRSEAVREALKQFLEHEEVFNDGLNPVKFHNLKEQQMNRMIH